MRNKLNYAIVCFGAVLISACSTPMPKDPNDQQYIAYLVQRIEILDSAPERNEYAVVGVNRRVDGLNNLVTAPPARTINTTPAPIVKGEVQDDRRNPTSPDFERFEQQPEQAGRTQSAKSKRKTSASKQPTATSQHTMADSR
jgi:hypothetical protein